MRTTTHLQCQWVSYRTAWWTSLRFLRRPTLGWTWACPTTWCRRPGRVHHHSWAPCYCHFPPLYVQTMSLQRKNAFVTDGVTNVARSQDRLGPCRWNGLPKRRQRILAVRLPPAVVKRADKGCWVRCGTTRYRPNNSASRVKSCYW